jgi:hypothetical protein
VREGVGISWTTELGAPRGRRQEGRQRVLTGSSLYKRAGIKLKPRVI